MPLHLMLLNLSTRSVLIRRNRALLYSLETAIYYTSPDFGTLLSTRRPSQVQIPVGFCCCLQPSELVGLVAGFHHDDVNSTGRQSASRP